MGNDEDRALEGFEEVDDDLLGFHVEVVGWLVEDEEVRLAEEQNHKREAHLFSTGE